jgi:T4 bacteriophage base plate protein
MSSKPANPLAKHFRRPTIYFKLPSKGKFWAEGSLELTATNDLPVYPMTSSDEITLKTPDSLMNGTSVTSVIESCCPNVKDAWEMPSIDVDAILIAIRIATFGTGMDISATCPHCKEKNDYTFNLTGLLDQISAPDYNEAIEFEGLKIKLRPQKYLDVNKANLINYEEQRILQSLTNAEITDDIRAAKLKESMQRIIELNRSLLVKGTEFIQTEDGLKVTDPEYINEFYENAETRVTNKIEKHLQKLAEEAALPLMEIICGNEECGLNFKMPLEFDYSSFFAVGS